MAFGSNQAITEMSTRNILGGKLRPESKDVDLMVIPELIV
jgi:hypothetical protein